MGVMDRFEKGIERAVNGVFAKAFRSEVQPVEIASALRKACDDKAAVISRGRTLVPNAFVVRLGATDHERLGEYADALGDELVANVREHADRQRYAFVGPVTVEFEQDDELDDRRLRDPHRHGQGPRGRAADPAARAARPGRGAPAVPARALADHRRPPSRRPWLDIDGHAYPLVGALTVVGRGDEADIVVDDPGVSRRHAEIRVTSDGPHLVATVRDLGSTNGTFVDGERIGRGEHGQPLGDGTTLTVGRTRATFRSGPR